MLFPARAFLLILLLIHRPHQRGCVRAIFGFVGTKNGETEHTLGSQHVLGFNSPPTAHESLRDPQRCILIGGHSEVTFTHANNTTKMGLNGSTSMPLHPSSSIRDESL